MFKHIMFPVDLHLPPEVRKAAEVVVHLARWQGAQITIVSVTGTQPGDPTQSEPAIQTHLTELSEELSQATGAPVDYLNIRSHDVAVEVDGDLARAAEKIGADLIVVGTHAPRITDFVLSSHAGYLAKHASMSVFVVR